MSPAVEVWSLNHWTAREVPIVTFFKWSIIYKNIELLCCTPETNTILYIKHTSLKIHIFIMPPLGERPSTFKRSHRGSGRIWSYVLVMRFHGEERQQQKVNKHIQWFPTVVSVKKETNKGLRKVSGKSRTQVRGEEWRNLVILGRWGGNEENWKWKGAKVFA